MDNDSNTAFLSADVFRRRQADRHVRARDHGFAMWMVGVSLAGDVVAVIGALHLAFWVRFETSVRALGRTDGSMSLDAYSGHFMFLSITLLLLLGYFKLYASGRPQRLRKVIAIIIASTFIWFLANVALSFELNTTPIISRIFLCCGFVCMVSVLMIWRWVFNFILGLPAVAALLQRRIVFVGWSGQAAKLLEHIYDDPNHPYQVVGYLPSANGTLDQPPPKPIQCLGEYQEIQEVLIDQAVDIVIVADTDPTRGSLRDLVTICEKEIVHLQIIPSCFQVLVSGLHLETTSGVPVLGVSRLPLDSLVSQCVKRTLDVVGAMVGLVLCAPLIAVFALLVHLESPGPVFYRQKRCGLGGKPFYILKIRSMRLDAERGQRPGWTQKNDPRRLRIGAFMRRWNIDEIPQFMNVLLGDMSLVGPRPERPEFIADFKESIPHYNARHGVKPGITGWAQINGFRGDTDLTERVKCDLFYMENWSALLDIQIMLMTFFKRANAG